MKVKRFKKKWERDPTPWSWELLREKFEERCDAGPMDRCWNWTGASTRGFGYIVYGSRTTNGGRQPRIQAHRLSWIFNFGEIPDGYLIGQECKNKLCVNPTHLYMWRR